MKTFKKIKYGIGIIAVIFIVACTVDPLENPIPEVETNVIENPDYEIIRSLGFQTEGIVEWEDFYIVEGDIIIDKVDIDSLKLKPATRQARHNNYITNDREESIRVKITSNNIPDASWRRAVRDAVDLWNSVPNCGVRFYKIEKQILAHDVKVEMSTSTTVAAANTPVNGRPGQKVFINPTIDWYNTDHEQKVYILVHEFGHILGLAHTDYIANFYADPDDHSYDNPSGITAISGTPLTEYASVMHSHSAGRYWGNPIGFTGGDILAIQNVYGTPEYNISIVGPDTLAPGETATYNIVATSHLQGYTGDFSTRWSADEELVVNRTNNSITIKCLHSAIHRTVLTAIVNFNGKQMVVSRVVN